MAMVATAATATAAAVVLAIAAMPMAIVTTAATAMAAAVVLTMAAYGALLFVVPDYLTGCLNMQPFGEPGCMPPLTPFYFFFVYFGVVINWIWFAVPVAMLAKTVRDDFVSAAARPKTS